MVVVPPQAAGHGAGVEVVHRPVGPGLEIHVGVHVHRAGQDVLAGGVDHLGVRGRQPRPHGLHHAVLQEQVGRKAAVSLTMVPF